MTKFKTKIIKKADSKNTRNPPIFSNFPILLDTSLVPSNRSKEINTINKYDKKINKKKRQFNQSLNLCNLPKEILEIIIGYINIWHHNRIRAACKTFMRVCDSALLHEYKMSIYKFGKSSPNGYEYAAMTAIEQATWAYVHAGYSSLFLGTMLPLIRNSYQNPFAPPTKKIAKFLKNFYKLVQCQIGDPLEQHSRFLYTLTLLGFFKKFKNCKLISSIDIRSEHWRVVYELCGSWFGMLWSSKQPSSTNFNYLTDRDELLILLTKLMISAHSENTFKKVWESENKIFVCGHDTSQRVHKPKVIFNFDIQGTQNIINCFKNIPIKGVHLWENIKNCPTDEFNLFLKINCKEAVKWGCYDYYELGFGPKCNFI